MKLLSFRLCQNEPDGVFRSYPAVLFQINAYPSFAIPVSTTASAHLPQRHGLLHPLPVGPAQVPVLQEADGFNNPAEVGQGRLARGRDLVCAPRVDGESVRPGSPDELISHGLDVAGYQRGVVPLFADVDYISLGSPLEHQLSQQVGGMRTDGKGAQSYCFLWAVARGKREKVALRRARAAGSPPDT